MADVKVGLSYSSEVVGCGGGGTAPSPVKKIYSRTGIIYCREIASVK